MKKIIERKIYNTETAQKLAGWCNNLSLTDYCYSSEDLYKTVNGSFFLHVWRGTVEDIVPLCEVEAEEWVEQCANKRFVEIFGKEFVQEA